MSRLSPDKLGEFYLRRIQPGIRKHGRGHPPWQKPTVLFIAGQPGAGKTTMQAAAIDRLGMKKAYVLDHDELLEKHPNYASGALENDFSASGTYGQDAGAWRSWALHDVQSRKMDVVVPFPLSGQHDLDLMKSFQDKGYRVEVAFAAVHESQSQLGIMERFNDGREEVGYGRWIPGEQHDQMYEGTLHVADAIEAQGLADAVHVYRRGEAEPVFTNERKNGVWQHQPGSTSWQIRSERNRPWTDREANHFVRGYNKLAELARRPLKDHFKQPPLMATQQGRDLLGKLHRLAAPKMAEHQRLTQQRLQAEAARTQAPQPHHQQPQQAQQQAAVPQWAAGVQGGPSAAQHQGQQPGQQGQPGAQQAGQHDWQRLALRVQAEQAPASGIAAPEQGGKHERPQGGHGTGTTRDDRGSGDNGRLAR
jgi:predicted ABC-type ATPase